MKAESLHQQPCTKGLTPKIELFGAVVLINSILPYFLFFPVNLEHVQTHLYLRFLGGILIAFLILKDSWVPFLKKYLPWVWYGTLMWTVPLTMTYVLLESQLHIGWTIDALVMLLFMAFFVRPISWALLCALGVPLGWLVYILSL